MADEETRPAALRPLGAEERTRRRLAVIGGGLVGLATAWAAAQIGGDQIEVDLYEAVAIAHEGGTWSLRASAGSTSAPVASGQPMRRTRPPPPAGWSSRTAPRQPRARWSSAS